MELQDILYYEGDLKRGEDHKKNHMDSDMELEAVFYHEEDLKKEEDHVRHRATTHTCIDTKLIDIVEDFENCRALVK